MKTLNQSSLILIGALALAGAAFGQVPSSNDTSDGNSNTGMGTGALGGPAATNGGIENTAAGFDALKANTSGNFNTALGDDALASNTTGSENTACGGSALARGATGSDNTGSGFQALAGNTGNDNTATGANTLFSNSTGNNNTASGYQALFSNTTGNDNTASGVNALQNSTTGSNNIAVGFGAGLQLTTGSHNIDIGNQGAAADTGTIRIGTAAQTKTFIAGIKGTSVSGSAVMISSTGQLGVTVSSERFKTAITPMGANTAKLEQLRPVTFHLKTDPHGALQYGLIAEEVAKVYPELVIRGEKGRIDGVRYDELAPMLLNEVQKQAAETRELKQQVADLKVLNQATQVALQRLQAKDELVAQR